MYCHIAICSQLFHPTWILFFNWYRISVAIVGEPLLQHGPPADTTKGGVWVWLSIEGKKCLQTPLNIYYIGPFTIVGQLEFRQKCWLSRLSDCPSHSWVLTFSFPRIHVCWTRHSFKFKLVFFTEMLDSWFPMVCFWMAPSILHHWNH